MNDKDFIISLLQKQVEMLMAENAELKTTNADLRAIIRTFAAQPHNVVVNSYNGSNAASTSNPTTNNTHHNDHTIDASKHEISTYGDNSQAMGKGAKINGR